MKAILLIVIFLSGFASLGHELIWSRILSRIFGNSGLTSASVISAFFLFLGLGSWWAGKVSRAGTPPFNPHPLLLLALAELGTASGSLSVFLLSSSPLCRNFWYPLLSGLSSSAMPLIIAAFGGSLAILSIPVFFMGSSFPLMCQILEKENSFKKTARQLAYGLNTGGAIFGCLMIGLAGMPFFGIKASWAFCTSCNLAAACTCYWLFKQLPAPFSAPEQPEQKQKQKQEEEEEEEEQEQQKQEQKQQPKQTPVTTLNSLNNSLLLLAAFTTGAGTTLMELCWSRLLSQFFGSSLLCWIVLLSTCLAAIAAGTYLAVVLSRLSLSTRLIFLFSSFLLSSWLAMAMIPAWINLIIWLSPKSPEQFPSLILYLLPLLLICLLYVLPSFSLISAVFPSLLYKEGKQTSATLYAVNCAGAFFAGILTMLLVFTAAAPGTSIFIVLLKFNCYVQGLLFLLLLHSVITLESSQSLPPPVSLPVALPAVQPVYLPAAWLRPWSRRQLFYIAALLCLSLCLAIRLTDENRIVLTLASAFGLSGQDERLFYGQQEQSKQWSSVAPHGLVFYKDGICSTVSKLLNKKTNTLSLLTDGKVDGSQPADLFERNDFTDLPTQKLLAALPLAAHPGKLTRVLNIGFGTGTTCNTMLNAAGIEDLIVSEIEPCVIEAAQKSLQETLPANATIHDTTANTNISYRTDRRLQIITQDCRFFLQTTNTIYDVIISQPSEPWTKGSGDLYSQEFFQLLKQHLAADGVFCQWLQIYAIDKPSFFKILATLRSVFPQVLVCQAAGAQELILLCSASPHPFHFNLAQVNTRLQNSAMQAALYPCDLATSSQLLNCIRLAPPEVDRWLQTYPITTLSSDDSLDLEARLACFIITPDTGRELTTMLNSLSSPMEHWLAALSTKEKSRFSADLALAETCRLTKHRREKEMFLPAQLERSYAAALNYPDDLYTSMRFDQLKELLLPGELLHLKMHPRTLPGRQQAKTPTVTVPARTRDQDIATIPKDTAALTAELYYLWHQHKIKSCLQHLNHNTTHLAESPELLNIKGWLLLHEHNHREAGECFATALRIKPVFPSALLGKALSLPPAELQASLDLARQAVLLQPNDNKTREFYARLLNRTKDIQEQDRDSSFALFIQELIEQKIAQAFGPW